MSMHLGGFSESLDPAAAFVNIAALQDDRLFTQGDDIRVPPLNQVVGVMGGADGVVAPRIRLTSPTLTARTRYEVSPLNSQDAAAVEPDSPAKYSDLATTPLVLGVDEILQAELNSNPAAVQIQWAFLWFADAPVVPVQSQTMYTVRGTGTTTAVANTWTSADITLDDNLVPGDYQVVGLRAEGATLVAARFIFRTADQWRPGSIGTDSILDIIPDRFRNGQMGVWGRFPFTQLPAVEILCMAADTAQTVHWDLIRTG